MRPLPPNDNHLPYLDAVRGLAAFWVLVSHAAILNAVYWPIVSEGGLAVDLFMMMSGFLMTHHYIQRSSAEPWDKSSTWQSFWLRRFFRIAPLFYVLLIISFLAGNEIGAWREQIAAVWPSTETTMLRYTDQSPLNAIIHGTFLFGLLPDYSFRTPLPDWSIGLEMQFYAVFPIVMLLSLRLGVSAAAFLMLATAFILQAVAPAYFHDYPMPANLALKIDVFLTGMLFAVAAHRADGRSAFFGLLALLVLVPGVVFGTKSVSYVVTQGVIALGFGALVLHKIMAAYVGQRWIENIVSMLDRRSFRFLGDTSYGVYLVHLLLMIPIIGVLSLYPAYVAMGEEYRVLIAVIVTAPPVYLISWGLHRTIEKYGIRLGKNVLKLLRPSLKSSHRTA
ncbi:acyltransferase family protein [Phyllobacterium chamaecytisi]|uniref:acyltransferase family protein n=1 Tax=Phyllobacterium chamaecytisi TaxID=2876082 RepID=UPI001CCA6724|nr:acyltransferase [Phyllobacterium sp. KW56]